MRVDQNSRRTRVLPILTWLRDCAPAGWPQRLVDLAHGLGTRPTVGSLEDVAFEAERVVAPSAERLAWMIENADRLIPRDGRLWRELRSRALDHPGRAEALARLRKGDSRIPRELKLEGKTHADCLIQCENALVWLEGKRNDWLDPATKWDSSRDQLARNVEAAWREAQKLDRDFCLIICHEGLVKHHEGILIDGYRSGTWTGGWPHLGASVRASFAQRIGTLTWAEIANEWPDLRSLPALGDLVIS